MVHCLATLTPFYSYLLYDIFVQPLADFSQGSTNDQYHQGDHRHCRFNAGTKNPRSDSRCVEIGSSEFDTTAAVRTGTRANSPASFSTIGFQKSQNVRARGVRQLKVRMLSPIHFSCLLPPISYLLIHAYTFFILHFGHFDGTDSADDSTSYSVVPCQAD